MTEKIKISKEEMEQLRKFDKSLIENRRFKAIRDIMRLEPPSKIIRGKPLTQKQVEFVRHQDQLLKNKFEELNKPITHEEIFEGLKDILKFFDLKMEDLKNG